jgi:Domain of unknown function (DUF4283)
VGLWRTDRHVNPLVVASLTSVSPWMPHTVYIGGGEEPKYLRAWPELLGVVLALIPHQVYIGYGRTCPGEGSPIKETTDPNLPQIIARPQSQPKMAGFRCEEEIKGQESRDFPFVWRISKSYLALLYLQILAYLFPILLSLLRNFKTATTTIMERISTEDMALVNRFEALAVRSRPRQAIQPGENEISEKNWGCCLVFIVVTTRAVVFMHLKEALHKGWRAFDLVGITRSIDGLYVAEFANEEARNRVLAQSPWHFKQDILALASLSSAPRESDKAACRIHTWVQLHHAPFCMLEPTAIRRLVREIGEMLDPALEDREKWEKYARLKMILDPSAPLCDKIPLLLPKGERWEVLVHYERLPTVCLYCAQIGHEVEGCDARNNLMAHIKTYPTKLHELLREKLRPSYGGWVNKDYLMPRVGSRKGDMGAVADQGSGSVGRDTFKGDGKSNFDINAAPPAEHDIPKRPMGRIKRGSAHISQQGECSATMSEDPKQSHNALMLALVSSVLMRESQKMKKQKAVGSALPLHR